jgi:fructuronate reductase
MERFDNPHLHHRLAQIAADGSQKLPVRVVPVLRAERVLGRLPRAGARIVAAWALHVAGQGTALVQDDGLAGAPHVDTPEGCLRLVAPDLASDSELIRVIAQVAREISSR